MFEETKSAVLFLVFNRPDTTAKVFEAIRSARPSRLYVAADGPRRERVGEAERCEDVRRIATAVDWPCEVRTLFRHENLGCKVGVSTGINWFFEFEKEGIILEDDVLPLPSFFPYCDALLERFRDDERVGMISGCNLASGHIALKESYFFSRHVHIWGWATWRRAWQYYDSSMIEWPAWRDDGQFSRYAADDPEFAKYLMNAFDDVHSGKIDTWDYQWLFACWHMNALSIVPARNQTHNLGFGPDATHTTVKAPSYVVESLPQLLLFPLVHPDKIERNVEADLLVAHVTLKKTFLGEVKEWVRAVPWLGNQLAKIRRILVNV